MRTGNPRTRLAYPLPSSPCLPPPLSATTGYVSTNGTYRMCGSSGTCRRERVKDTHMSTHLPLVLASASPRRRQILARLDLPYTVRVAPADEDTAQRQY